MPGLFDSGGGPEFSLVGMLLGGRGYAANWFQQRDQMAWAKAAQAAQDAAEQQYGAELLSRPDYQRFRDNPTDRAAGLDFWAGTRGAPGDIDQDISGYVGTGITAIYNRQQAALQQQLQKETLAFSTALDRQTYDYRNEKDLQLYKDKAAFDAQRNQAILDSLNGVPGEVANNIRFDLQFPGVRPQGQSVGVGEDGSLYMRPATGTPEFTKMSTQLTAGQTMIDQIGEMSTKLERGDYSVATWKAEQASLMMTAKSLFESGALDADSLAVMQSMIPKLGVFATVHDQSKAQEALRATVLMLKRRNADVAASYAVPLKDLPEKMRQQKYFPEPRGEPPPQGRVKAAQESIKQLPPPEQQTPAIGGFFGPLGSGENAPVKGWGDF